MRAGKGECAAAIRDFYSVVLESDYMIVRHKPE